MSAITIRPATPGGHPAIWSALESVIRAGAFAHPQAMLMPM